MSQPPVDLQDIIGQEHVKRALEVAAAGGHTLLLSGPPGAGKTMLARALLGILPPAADDTPVPFVAPPATTTLRRLIGTPEQDFGELSRAVGGALVQAWGGVLFLNDLPSFGSKLHVLAAALDGAFPGEPAGMGCLLVAAQQPCPCGWRGEPERICTCTPALVARYRRQVPQALLRHLAIHVTVPHLRVEQLTSGRLGEPSAAVRARVLAARARQAARSTNGAGPILNANLGPAAIRTHCLLDGAAQSLAKAAVRQLSLSAQAYHQLLRLARTIADLAGAELIGAAHVAEAVQYRQQEEVM